MKTQISAQEFWDKAFVQPYERYLKEESQKAAFFQEIHQPGDLAEITRRIEIFTKAMKPENAVMIENETRQDSYTAGCFTVPYLEIYDESELKKEIPKRARRGLENLFKYSGSYTERYLAANALDFGDKSLKDLTGEWAKEIREQIKLCDEKGWEPVEGFTSRRRPINSLAHYGYVEGYYHACTQAIDLFWVSKNKSMKKIVKWIYKNAARKDEIHDLVKNRKYIGEKLGYSGARIAAGLIMNAPIESFFAGNGRGEYNDEIMYPA